MNNDIHVGAPVIHQYGQTGLVKRRNGNAVTVIQPHKPGVKFPKGRFYPTFITTIDKLRLNSTYLGA